MPLYKRLQFFNAGVKADTETMMNEDGSDGEMGYVFHIIDPAEGCQYKIVIDEATKDEVVAAWQSGVLTAKVLPRGGGGGR